MSDNVICSFSCRTVITGQQYHKSYSDREGMAKNISYCYACLCSQLQSLALQNLPSMTYWEARDTFRYKNLYKAASQRDQIMESHQDMKCVQGPRSLGHHTHLFLFQGIFLLSQVKFHCVFLLHWVDHVPVFHLRFFQFSSLLTLLILCLPFTPENPVSDFLSFVSPLILRNFVNEYPVAASWQQKLESFMLRTILKPGMCESENNYIHSPIYPGWQNLECQQSLASSYYTV